MPQMSPLWWTTLFIMFICSMLMMWTLMYYQYEMTPSKKTLENNMGSHLTWKW